MDSSLSLNQGTLIVAFEASSLAFLLERGIDYTRQGSYLEGAAFFTLAREQLTPDQMHFAELIDALLQSQASYWLAQQSLQLANKHVVEADIERQTCLLALEKQFLTLNEETNTVLQIHATTKISGVYQSQQLQQPPQLTPDGSNRHDGKPSPPRLLSKNSGVLPDLYISCFGHFAVRRSGKPITLCSNRCGQRILRFLVSQPGHSATSDILLAMSWPEDETEVASRKLYLAISALRRSLSDDPACEPSRSYIVCKNRVYSLNPSVAVQTDVDEFLHCYRMGQQRSGERVALYERACQLYTGPFLPEDIYADWSFIQREQLTQAYLAMRNELTDHYLKTGRYEDAIQSAHAVLRENHCDEVAHRHLIQVYIAQGRRSEALQQYQRCERTLREELGVRPLTETTFAIQTLFTNDSPSTQQ